jgi:integrase
MILAALFEERYLPHVARTLKAKTVAEYTRLARAEILTRGWLAGREIGALTLDDAERLHAAVAGKVQANRAVSLLSGMLTYAVERKLLATNLCRGIARNREQGCEFYYTPAQTRVILSTAAGWDDIRARYIAVELLTGCRPNELLESGPSWRHGSVLRTPDGKTGGRTIFLPPLACAILDGLSGERYFPAGMDLRRAWDRICRDAGVPRKRLYDLRHTFASAALAAGESLPVIGLTLGHRKAQTTMKYTHLAPEIGLRAATAAAERMSA